jgi:hypothetical protein
VAVTAAQGAPLGVEAFARDGAAQHRRGAGRTDLGDVGAQVGAVAVDRLALPGQQVVDGLLLGADAAQRAAGARVVVDGAGVVVAELDQHAVARPDEGARALPVAAAAVGAAAQPADGAVDDVDARRIEQSRQHMAPAPLAERAQALAVVAAVAHRRVADQQQRGQGGIGRLGQVQGRRARVGQHRCRGRGGLGAALQQRQCEQRAERAQDGAAWRQDGGSGTGAGEGRTVRGER